MKGDFRKLDCVHSESLLRHPKAISKVKSLTDGAFQGNTSEEEVLKQEKHWCFVRVSFTMI